MGALLLLTEQVLGKPEKGQGLKPTDLIEFIGTTEVVPCYKALSVEFFS